MESCRRIIILCYCVGTTSKLVVLLIDAIDEEDDDDDVAPLVLECSVIVAIPAKLCVKLCLRKSQFLLNTLPQAIQ